MLPITHISTKSKLRKPAWLGVSLIAFIMVACGQGAQPTRDAESTEIVLFPTRTLTLTPTLTPDCPPVVIETPSPKGASPILVVALFDGDTNYASYTSSAFSTVSNVLANAQPDDTLFAFQLGIRNFEEALITNQQAEKYTGESIPPSPTPHSTITPTSPPLRTPKPGSFEAQVATVSAASTQVAIDVAATKRAFEYTCVLNEWERVYESQAVASEATRTAIVASFVDDVQLDLETGLAGQSAGPALSIPNQNELIEGLSYATLIFQNECSKFNRCILLIFSDVYDWRYDQPWLIPDKLNINFSGINVATIMLHCKLRYDPQCVAEQNAFRKILRERKKVNGDDIVFVNGDGLNGEGLEEFLTHFIWR